MGKKKNHEPTFQDMLNQWSKEWHEFIKGFIKENQEEIISNIEEEGKKCEEMKQKR